jgi:hypothetical protein
VTKANLLGFAGGFLACWLAFSYNIFGLISIVSSILIGLVLGYRWGGQDAAKDSRQ